MLGTKAPAEQGKLVVLASGPDDAARRASQPIFDVIGARTMWVGEAGRRHAAEARHQHLDPDRLEGAAETLALAEGLGLDPQLVLDAVAAARSTSRYLQMKGKAMMARDFEPSFRLRAGGQGRRAGGGRRERHDLDLPLVSAIRRAPRRGRRPSTATRT